MKIEITKKAAQRARDQFMSNAELGMAWWNGMTERERAETLRAAGTDVPAVAWEHWRATTASNTGAKL